MAYFFNCVICHPGIARSFLLIFEPVRSGWTSHLSIFNGQSIYLNSSCNIYISKMKIWTSEHTFNHPWETVAQATWRKYPNPMNPAVVGIDVVERTVCDGVLKSHRLISTKWGLPDWAIRVLGADRTCYASEHSEVDPDRKILTFQSRNLTFCNELSIIERLTYFPDPNDKNCTLLKQEALVTVKGIPLSSYLEAFVANTISNNAGKGRQAMEWVISKINCEVQELTNRTVKSMDEISSVAKKGMGDLSQFAEPLSAKSHHLHFKK